MKYSRLTFKINDDTLNQNFKTYMERKAVKLLPFHIFQSMLAAILIPILFGGSFRTFSCFFYLICSLFGYALA
jgi:hypothetical protein